MPTDRSVPLALAIDAEALRPLVEQVVEATLLRLEVGRSAVGDRMAYPEPVAAAMLSMQAHQLRDERLKGRVAASRVAGRKIRYLRSDLLDYLMRERSEAS